MAQTLSERANSQQSPTTRLVGAAALYFLIVFGAGFVLGPIRVFWLEPVIGPAAATLCEAPLLLAAMVFAALWVPSKIGVLISIGSLLKMGLIALTILIVADVLVGTAIRGSNWADQFAYFASPAGLIYLGLLAVFTLMPALINTDGTAD
jgi:hypothetical protein